MDENHLYEAEVFHKDILRIMKTNVYDNYFKNNYHYISSEYLMTRSSLFSLIRKISNQMGFKSQTFFLSIYYLDILFSKNKKIECNYKILGLACLLLSAKYIENDPCVPNLANFIKVYNNLVDYKYFISATDLFYAEVLTCKMLGYKLNYYTIYDFDSFFFSHGIIKIEQLREINNGIYSNFVNGNNFEINSSNSVFIRKILEKIYHKSRQLLELIINNSKICLKYNSFLISIFIMKKSVEEILFEEQRINKHDFLRKEKFAKKTSKYYKDIMKELYEIDYESIEEYNALIADRDLIKLLQEEKKNELSPALINLENNIRLANNSNTIDKDNNLRNYNYRDIYYILPSYSHMKNLKSNSKKNSFNNNNIINSNSHSKENQIIKKLNLNRQLSRYNKYQKLVTDNSYRLSSKKKNNEKSIPKKNNLITSYLDISNISNNKELNNCKINRPLRHSEIDCVKFLQKYTTCNDFGNKKNESISMKTNNNKSISIDNNDDLIDIINTLDNGDNKNKTIKMDSPPRLENDSLYNIEKIRKINAFKNRLFNGDILDKKDNSIILIDKSSTINTMNGETITSNENIKNLDKYKNIGKPYFRKVIRNTIINHDNTNNYSKTKRFKQSGKTKSISYLANDSDNFVKKRDFNSIMTIPFSCNNKNKDKDKDENLNNLNSNMDDKINTEGKNLYEYSGKKNNYNKKRIIDYNNIDSKSTINKKREQQIPNNNKRIIITQRNSFFNIKKKIDENNEEKEKKDENKENKRNNDEKKRIKENKEEKEKKGEDTVKENQKKEEKEISKYSSSSNFYLKRREREKIFLNRMNNNKKTDNDNENKDEKMNKTSVNTKNTNDETKDDIKDYNNNKTNIETKESKSEVDGISDYLESRRNIISKRKYFLSNKKPTDYKSQIRDINNTSNNGPRIENLYEKDNIINNGSIKESNYKSIRQKYMNKMHSKKKENNKLTDIIMTKDNEEQLKIDIKEENIKNNVNNKGNNLDIKVNKINRKRDYKNNIRNITSDNDYIKDKEKEKNYLNKKSLEIKLENEPKSNFAKNHYPTSSIFKLLNRAKKIANNNTDLELSKEKLKIDITNNFHYNFNKRKRSVKSVRTFDNSESKSKEKEKYETNIPKKEIIPRKISYHTIGSEIGENNTINNNNNNGRGIHSYHHRNILKNKIQNNNESSNANSNNTSNNNINIQTNKTTNTIVINNNININFNNKIDPIQGRYIRSNILKRNTTDVNNNNECFNKIIINSTNKNNSHQKTIIEKYYDNNNYNRMRGKDNYKKGTIECINSSTNNSNNQNYSISSLLHRLPIYKKTLDNNRKILSRESSVGIKHND